MARKSIELCWLDGNCIAKKTHENDLTAIETAGHEGSQIGLHEALVSGGSTVEVLLERATKSQQKFGM